MTIENVKYREKLFAGSSKLDRQRRRALTYPRLHASDPVAQWEVNYFRPGLVTIRSTKHWEYLFAGYQRKDPFRRHAVTWIPSTWDASKDTKGQWRIIRYARHGRAEAAGTNVTAFDMLGDKDANTTIVDVNTTKAGEEPLTTTEP